MRNIILAGVALLACTPKNAGKSSQTEASLILSVGYRGGLVPAQALFSAPFLVILENGGVFKLAKKGDLYSYKGLKQEDRNRIHGLANQLWESGLQGEFSAMAATDLPSLVIELQRGEVKRTISVYGYERGRIKKNGGEALDSLMDLAMSARGTKETWVPYEVELRVMSWFHDTTGWRIYDWEGPILPLDSLAEMFVPMRLSGDTAREVREYLDGKTIYTRRDMALFRYKGKRYAIAILPLVK